MIHVPRTPFNELPKEIQEYLGTNAAKAKKFYSLPAKNRAQKRFPFADPDKNPALKDFLIKEFHGKCAYSEASITATDAVVIGHRPFEEAIGADGQVARDHYWWLAYEWGNLLPVQRDIARSKGNHFPVMGQRSKIGSSLASIQKNERAIIPDPSYGNLKIEIPFLDQGRLVAPGQSGDYLNLLRLNSKHLMSKRESSVTALEKLRHFNLETLPEYGSELALDLEFVAYRSQLVAERISDHLDRFPQNERAVHLEEIGKLLGESLPGYHPIFALLTHLQEPAKTSSPSVVPPPRTDIPTPQGIIPLTITHLHIHNFKGIYSLKIPFPQDDHLEENEAPSGLMVLGENGSGKSTILQAITLALADPQNVTDIPFLNSKKILRRGTKSGFVRLTLLDQPEPLEVRFRRGSSKFQFSGPRDSLHFFFRAYGAHRLLPRYNNDSPLPENPNPISILNLWDPYESLIDAEKWILAQPQAFFDIFARSLKDLLNLGDDGRIYRKGKKLHFDIGQRDLALDELSAGYQSVIATATDIIAGYPIQGLDMQSGTGVVLIDEIGAHLHPSWRMRIVHAYRRTFPKIQFICTTHEPLCLRGVRQNELLVLEKQHKTIRPIEDLPDLEGMRIDQILTSPIFGLNTTIDPEVEAKFQEYYLLLQIESPNAPQQKRSDELRSHLYRYGILGASRRAQAIYDIIDNDLSLHSSTRGKSEISPETRKKVLEIWNESQFQNLS